MFLAKVIAVFKVHELLSNIGDILNNAVSKGVGNAACILGYLFNSVSRQCHGVFTILRPLPHSEACIYGDINRSLVQAQQQTSLGSSQSSTSMRGSKVKP